MSKHLDLQTTTPAGYPSCCLDRPLRNGSRTMAVRFGLNWKKVSRGAALSQDMQKFVSQRADVDCQTIRSKFSESHSMQIQIRSDPSGKLCSQTALFVHGHQLLVGERKGSPHSIRFHRGQGIPLPLNTQYPSRQSHYLSMPKDLPFNAPAIQRLRTSIFSCSFKAPRPRAQKHSIVRAGSPTCGLSTKGNRSVHYSGVCVGDGGLGWGFKHEVHARQINIRDQQNKFYSFDGEEK